MFFFSFCTRGLRGFIILKEFEGGMWCFPGCVNPNYVYEHTPPGTELYEDKKKLSLKSLT